jgi:hypothetical protein
MDQLINTLSSDPGIALGAVGIIAGCTTGILITVTAIVASNWSSVRQTEENNALKHYMLEQGMSAEEIATVIAAKPGKKNHGCSSLASFRPPRRTAQPV